MKPLHLISRYDNAIRPRRASIAEIREIVESKTRETDGHRLAHVTVNADGDVEAVPLTEAEILEIDHTLRTSEIEIFRKMLDQHLALYRIARDHRAVTRAELSLWPTHAPYVEAEVLAWAERNGLTVKQDPIPANAKSWIRVVEIHDGDYWNTVLRMQWPSVDVGDGMTSVEIMCHAVAKLGEPDAVQAPSVEVQF